MLLGLLKFYAQKFLDYLAMITASVTIKDT